MIEIEFATAGRTPLDHAAGGVIIIINEVNAGLFEGLPPPAIQLTFYGVVS